MAKVKALKLTWKKDDGSHEETDDLTLWANGHPLNITISGALYGWYGVLYLGDKEAYMADTRKEIKLFFDEDPKCQAFLKKELAAYGM